MNALLKCVARDADGLIALARARKMTIGGFYVTEDGRMIRDGVEVQFLGDRIVYGITTNGRNGRETIAGGFENHKLKLVLDLLKLLQRNHVRGP